MARPRKWKRVCDLPKVRSFVQNGGEQREETVLLSVEEYEVLRLIDHENMTQQECAQRMEVSRPTVQILYDNARKKLVSFLVNGGSLRIEGGSYRLCTGEHAAQCHCNCGKCTCRKRHTESAEN